MSSGKVGAPIKHINPEIAVRIVKLRKDCNITQFELADLIGVSRDSVRNWEHSRNEPSKECAKKMGNVFKCSYKYILCIEDEEIIIPKTLQDYSMDELLAEIKRRTEAS